MVVPRSRITFSLPVKVTSPLLFYPHFLSVPYVEATLGCARHPTALKVIQRRLGFVQFLIDPYLLYSREVGRYYIEVLPYRGIPVGLHRALGHIQFTISLLYAGETIGIANRWNRSFTRDFRQTRAAAECLLTDTRHTPGESYRIQKRTIAKSIVVYPGHPISISFMFNRFRYCHSTPLRSRGIGITVTGYFHFRIGRKADGIIQSFVPKIMVYQIPL